MSLILKLTWRNTWRNPRRSLITVAAIAVGVASLVFFWALIDGVHEQVIRLSCDVLPGEIQIHKKGFAKNPALEDTIQDVDTVRKVIASHPEISGISERIKTYALASSAEDSAGVMVLAVKPEQEMKVTYFYDRVITGEYLKPDDVKGVLLGKILAENLNVGVGDKVVLLSQAADGSLGAEAFRVRGIVDFSVTELNSGAMIAHIEGVASMLYLTGIHEFALKLKDLRKSDEIKKELQAQLGKQYEVLTWKDIMPFLYQGIEMDNASMYLILIIVTIIAGFGVMNTILMSVTERTREFGIMHAMGADMGMIFRMVVLESIMLNLIGVAAGMGLGILLSVYFNHVGIDLSNFSDIMEMFAMPKVLYPYFTADSLYHVTSSVGVIFLVAVLASLYPAYKVSRLQPVEAIKYV